MTSLVQGLNGSQPFTLYPTLDKPTLNLEAIRNARGNINEIRMLLKGNVGTCHRLFRQAVEEGDAVTQIQLSHALFGMEWGKDATKDFSSLVVGDLETFDYYPKEFILFNLAYDKAMGIKSEFTTKDARGAETFRLAASRGYLPAVLELTDKRWGLDIGSYGFAVQLRPFVGKGDKKLNYSFGNALANECPIGSQLYYEGLYWMDQSCGIPKHSLKDLKRYYQERICVGQVFSNEAWDNFVKEKLAGVKIAPMEAYLFNYDAEKISSLLNKYKISVLSGGDFVESSSEGYEVNIIGERKTLHGFHINTLTLYKDHERIGEISIRKDTFKIHQTVKDPEIQPVIEFIENIMTRSGSASSANSWLRRMGSMYI